MSRTWKGTKGPGHEYWGRRPQLWYLVGKTAKKYTHKRERAANKDTTEVKGLN